MIIVPSIDSLDTHKIYTCSWAWFEFSNEWIILFAMLQIQYALQKNFGLDLKTAICIDS